MRCWRTGRRHQKAAIDASRRRTFRVVVVVGVAGKGELWWWDPLGSAIGEFLCAPALPSSLWCGAQAKVRLSMSVGPPLGPVVDVVDFAEVPGNIASRVRAATVFGVQHDSLVG